ncbi:MAG: DUF1800 domain-containing protein [Candidatus Eremiobacteraeota bacterium]|nr:DUF1800 domain-containing protein [Candidatus Eremiobacteraeota bacterium]
MASTTYRPPGTLDLANALLPYRGPWDVQKAAHLLRRAGFGGSPADIARVAAMPMNVAVDRLIEFPPNLPDAPELVEDRPNPAVRRLFAQNAASALTMLPAGNAAERALQMLGAAAAAAPPRPAQPPPPPSTAVQQQLAKAHQQNTLALQQWWLQRMIASPAPLQEKMTLFWHGHFTSAYQAKGITAQDILQQNQLYRRFALGNVHELTREVSKDPAMLKYLDNRTSRKEHANENYARELMELFTLGIGNYTETDVRESARAFTGYTLDRDDRFVFNRAIHDDGVKTFLGRTGNFTGDDIVDIIFAQPAAPRFFASELLGYFLYSDPEPALIDALAALIRKNNFELRPVLSALLRSNVFYSGRAYRALVKSPTEFVVGAHQLYGLSDVDPAVLGAMRRMGQVLFYPPNVKGWDGGDSWLNSGTVLTRENFASALCRSPQMMQEATWLTADASMEPKAVAARIVQWVLVGDASPSARARLEQYLSGAGTAALGMLSGENFDERVRGAAYLAMAMPAYQLA